MFVFHKLRRISQNDNVTGFDSETMFGHHSSPSYCCDKHIQAGDNMINFERKVAFGKIWRWLSEEAVVLLMCPGDLAWAVAGGTLCTSDL